MAAAAAIIAIIIGVLAQSFGVVHVYVICMSCIQCGECSAPQKSA